MLLNVNIYKYIGYIAIISSIYLIGDYIYNDSRYQYEKFLKSKYNTNKNYSEDDLKNIPKPEHPHLSKFQDKLMTMDPSTGDIPAERLRAAFIYTKNLQQELDNRDDMDCILLELIHPNFQYLVCIQI